jgi:hypothetical protein
MEELLVYLVNEEKVKCQHRVHILLTQQEALTDRHYVCVSVCVCVGGGCACDMCVLVCVCLCVCVCVCVFCVCV